MFTEKIKLFNNLQKCDYEKTTTNLENYNEKGKELKYKLKEDLISDLDIELTEVENLFITEEEYGKLPG